MLRQTPLAWRNLIHDKRRLATALCGIGFAVLLMFVETGVRYALFDSTVQVVRELDADIIIISSAKYSFAVNQQFLRSRIYQTRSVEGIQGAYPLYMESFRANWQAPRDKGRSIRVLAFEPGDPVFLNKDVRRKADLITPSETALADAKSKSQLRLPTSDEEAATFEGGLLGGVPVRVVGTFEMGTDFANDGNVVVSAANFAKYFPYRAMGEDPLTLVDVGVVHVEGGRDIDEMVERLNSLLPDDVEAFSRLAFIEREIGFWNEKTPIGIVFFVGTVMGFVVGVIICYQIIYTDLSEHLPEFATLKAMGYSNLYFISVVLFQAVYLSLLGFIPGALVSLGLYAWLANTTGLLMSMTVPRAAIVLGLTVLMCVVSGCLAIRRVLSADPASLF
jgi:putative ABC transport system permease protein